MTERVWQLLIHFHNTCSRIVGDYPTDNPVFYLWLVNCYWDCLGANCSDSHSQTSGSFLYLGCSRDTTLGSTLCDILWATKSRNCLGCLSVGGFGFLSIQVPTLRKPYGLLSSPCLCSWRLAILSG